MSMKKMKELERTEKFVNMLDNGNSLYKIVISENATACENRAAKEIAKYFALVSGIEIDIVNDKNSDFKNHGKIISVGKTAALKNSGLILDYSALKDDGFIIGIQKGCVFIDGVSDRGVLYGAYEFIEKIFGVKFLAYDYTYIPRRDSIKLYDISGVYNPEFPDRVYLSNSVMTMGKFAAKLRMVSEFTDIPEEYGGSIQWFKDNKYLSNYAHNTLSYVEPEKYLKKHPEWFYVDENGDTIDLCHAHIGLNEDGTIDENLSESPVKTMVERMKECIINSAPSIKYFMIGQMDINKPCKCEGCLALEKKYKRSGMTIRLANAVSDAIGKWLKAEQIEREIYFCVFAYQYSQSAPVNEDGEPLDETVIPRDNVIVRLAPIRANNYYGLIDARQNDDTRNMMTEWRNVAKKTMMWTYHTRYSFPFTYYPTMQHWKKDFELYREMGCQYVYLQSDHMELNDWKANMEAYVASKMLWDITLDPFALREEYINLYYDIIAAPVKEYIKNFETLFEKIMESDNKPDMRLQGKDEILKAEYYGEKFWEKQFLLLEKMYKEIEKFSCDKKKYAQFRNKVDRIKLNAEYMTVYSYNDYAFDGSFIKKEEDLKNDFFETCDRLNVKQTGEWQKLDQLKELWGYRQKDKKIKRENRFEVSENN